MYVNIDFMGSPVFNLYILDESCVHNISKRIIQIKVFESLNIKYQVYKGYYTKCKIGKSDKV